jgi:hypothetical protein
MHADCGMACMPTVASLQIVRPSDDKNLGAQLAALVSFLSYDPF